jgi:ribosome biogenesis GTPase A
MKKKNNDLADTMVKLVREGTKKWRRIRKSEERSPSMRRYRMARMTNEKKTAQKEAAAQVMEEAYMAASSGGRRRRGRCSTRRAPRSWR